MFEFFDEIRQEVEATPIDEELAPREARAEGEVLLGVMSERLKRIYACRALALLRMRTFEKVLTESSQSVQHDGNGADGAFCGLCREYDTARLWYEFTETLFWLALHREFPDALGKSYVGPRAGWQVVWRDDGWLEEEGGAECSEQDGYVGGGGRLSAFAISVLETVQPPFYSDS